MNITDASHYRRPLTIDESLRVTADFSHFVVVCERLLDQGEEDKELLRTIIPHVSHKSQRDVFAQG